VILKCDTVIIFITHDGGEEDSFAPVVVFCCLEFLSMMVPQVQLSCCLPASYYDVVCQIQQAVNICICTSTEAEALMTIVTQDEGRHRSISLAFCLEQFSSEERLHGVYHTSSNHGFRMCHCLWEQRQILTKRWRGLGAKTVRGGWLADHQELWTRCEGAAESNRIGNLITLTLGGSQSCSLWPTRFS
jgi:hypothetical protein